MNDLKRSVERADEKLEEALEKNVHTIGFGGVEEMKESRKILQESGIEPTDSLSTRQSLTLEEGAGYALNRLNRVVERYENEPQYAGYDTMMAARRALVSALSEDSPLELVDDKTLQPHNN